MLHPAIQAAEAQSLENADVARYRELTVALSDCPAEIDTLKHQAMWSELEQIKNRHGGYAAEFSK